MAILRPKYFLGELRRPTPFRSAYSAGLTLPDDNTMLLLHCDGTDGSTGIVDAAHRHTITVTPTFPCRLDSNQSVFGGTSLYNDVFYVDTAGRQDDFGFGTGAFTIEMWVRNEAWHAEAIPPYQDRACFCRHLGVTDLTFRYDHDDHELDLLLGGTLYSRSWTPSLNAWYHLAVTRDGSQDVRLFINGNQQGATENDATAVSSGDLRFMALSYGYEYVLGWMDEIRVSDICRYSVNFTPPVVPFR